jgi:arylsulfatase A-like enzyme
MMGCYGNDEIFTPHLDDLASRGVLFRNAFCPNSMCSPCRASMLTGLMPSQHGIHTWLDDEVIDEWPDNYNAIAEFETLPEILAKAGYHTALIGKYHLGFADKPQNGFKHWVTMAKGMMPSFYGVEMNDNGKYETADEHSVDYFTRKCVEYLDLYADKDEPFFLFNTYNAPYGEMHPDEPEHRYSQKYAELLMKSVPREGLCPELIDWILMRKEKAPDYDFEWYKKLAEMPNNLRAMRQFYSQMSMVDDGVGQMIAKLEELVGTTDIYATILDIAGCELEFPESTFGTSLCPLLCGDDIDLRDEVFMEQEETRAIRTSKWLFMRRIENTSYDFKNELYDLENDPDERKNIAEDPTYADVVKNLSERLDKFFTDYANPRWDLWKGGTVKSNSTRPFLWKEIWGDNWTPEY